MSTPPHLRGMNGQTGFSLEEAVKRLKGVANVERVFGVSVKSDSGHKKECPIGVGYHAAIKFVQSLEGIATSVFLTVTIA